MHPLYPDVRGAAGIVIVPIVHRRDVVAAYCERAGIEASQAEEEVARAQISRAVIITNGASRNVPIGPCRHEYAEVYRLTEIRRVRV